MRFFSKLPVVALCCAFFISSQAQAAWFTSPAAAPKTTQTGEAAVAQPSAGVLRAATAQRKDRHGMPVYPFTVRNRLVRTTAYHPNESDHLIYGSKNATGTVLRYGERVRSAAADWSFYPVGTVFRVAGQPYLYVVDDYGSALTGTATIDIFKPNNSMMKDWGTRNVEITIIQWGSFKRSTELLAARTKFWHCRQMLTNIQRQQSAAARMARN